MQEEDTREGKFKRLGENNGGFNNMEGPNIKEECSEGKPAENEGH
jgi:hypothetical protein